tara:strand:- start:34 stop:216 length:183 start_codon:yes stop_codon:yes gene_type:complete
MREGVKQILLWICHRGACETKKEEDTNCSADTHSGIIEAAHDSLCLRKKFIKDTVSLKLQ